MVRLEWMVKKAAAVVLSLLLAFSTFAADKADKKEKTKNDSKTVSEAAKPAEKAKERVVSNEELLGAMEQLRGLISEQNRKLEVQQQKIAELESRLSSNGNPPALAAAASAGEPQNGTPAVELLEKQLEAVADSTNALQSRVTQMQTDATAVARANDGKFRQLGNFRLSGDLRYRYEPFLQDAQTTRQRQRVRGRLTLQGNITDTIFGGVTLATGTLDDPISTNQTLGAFFNRFSIGFDRAWMQWTPKNVFRGHATFGGGKFAYPWIRTPLTFDNDLNPNGIYTRLNWDFKNAFFKGITLVGMELPIFERGGSTSATTGIRADGYDSNAGGTQIQTRWKFGNRVTFGTNLAYIAFNSPDIIAQAHSVTAATASVTNNLTGNAPITNCVRTNATNQVVGYCSKFGYLNWVSTMGIVTPWAKYPVNLTFDFNNNVRATRVIQRGTAAPTGQVDNPERSAYWAEFQIGRQSERKDLQFGWVFARVERDAVITAFNESDFRAGSNLAQHRFNLYYRAFNNVTVSYQLWLGHVVNAADPFTGTGGAIALVPGGKRALAGTTCNVSPFSGCRDNLLKRMQFDIIYSF